MAHPSTDYLTGTQDDASYNSLSADVDKFMWNYPDALLLFAAGNSGRASETGAYTVSAPATLKNGVTVGASLNDRYSFLSMDSSGSGSGYSSFLSVDGLAAFSSRGPTKDGRIKPDVVASGSEY
jgi:hypothetical protein